MFTLYAKVLGKDSVGNRWMMQFDIQCQDGTYIHQHTDFAFPLGPRGGRLVAKAMQITALPDATVEAYFIVFDQEQARPANEALALMHESPGVTNARLVPTP